MEKGLWMVERIKSGLLSFALEISLWTMRSRAVEIDSGQIITLLENKQDPFRVWFRKRSVFKQTATDDEKWINVWNIKGHRVKWIEPPAADTVYMVRIKKSQTIYLLKKQQKKRSIRTSTVSN